MWWQMYLRTMWSAIRFDPTTHRAHLSLFCGCGLCIGGRVQACWLVPSSYQLHQDLYSPLCCLCDNLPIPLVRNQKLKMSLISSFYTGFLFSSTFDPVFSILLYSFSFFSCYLIIVLPNKGIYNDETESCI